MDMGCKKETECWDPCRVGAVGLDSRKIEGRSQAGVLGREEAEQASAQGFRCSVRSSNLREAKTLQRPWLSHPACLGWERCAKGTSREKQGKCVWLCYGNQVCFYRIWQPDLVLSQGELK